MFIYRPYSKITVQLRHQVGIRKNENLKQVPMYVLQKFDKSL